MPITVLRRKLHSLGRSVSSQFQFLLLLLPAVVYVFIFNYIPMYGVQIAFKDFSSSAGIWGSTWVGLRHFIRFVNYPYFARIVWNTVSINLYSLAAGFPIPVILALLINEVNNRAFKRTVQMVTYAPHFISTVVICGMIVLFLDDQTGFVNKFISMLGLKPVKFVSEPVWFSTIYVWSGIWQNAGWGTIIYLAALSGVSPELIEAARIDGANRFGVIVNINIPQILPTTVILLILRCGSLFSLGFEKVWLLQNSLNLEVSEIISTYVYKVGLQGGEFSYSSAIGLFNTGSSLN
jgi:putative aldouronate transport system permease protein